MIEDNLDKLTEAMRATWKKIDTRLPVEGPPISEEQAKSYLLHRKYPDGLPGEEI